MDQIINEFIGTANYEISLLGFTLNLLLTTMASIVLGRIYINYGSSISNRTIFSRNFFLISITTMLVITVIKSSLALSLGLVGALSIIRFRAAIKEPEEIAYLFLAIAIGLGFGADQRLITIVGLSIIFSIIIIIRSFNYQQKEDQNLFITLCYKNIALSKIVDIMKEYFSVIDIKRYDDTEDMVKVSFYVEFDDYSSLEKITISLRKLDKDISLNFIDNKIIF